MTPPRPHFRTPHDDGPPLTYGARRYRWWQWRQRRARLATLERIACMEIRANVDGATQISTTVEDAYLMAKYGAGFGSAAAIGVQWLPLFAITGEHNGVETRASVELRLPLPVTL